RCAPTTPARPRSRTAAAARSASGKTAVALAAPTRPSSSASRIASLLRGHEPRSSATTSGPGGAGSATVDPVDELLGERADLGAEALLREARGRPADRGGVERGPGRLHDRPADGRRLDARQQPAGLAVGDDVEGAARRRRDHGNAARLRFGHRDPEVLDAGEDEALRGAVELAQLLVREAGDEP